MGIKSYQRLQQQALLNAKVKYEFESDAKSILERLAR